MELILKRINLMRSYTEGELYVMKEGVPERFCETLEPHRRDLRCGEAKVMGETAIPEGKYRVSLDMSPKYGRLMPYVQDVPQFTNIMLHPGNDVEDTKGCILVGQRLGLGKLINSRKTFDVLFGLMGTAKGEEITITVI